VAYNFQPERTNEKCFTAKELVKLTFVGFEIKLPGFDEQRPGNCSVFPLLFGTGHYQSLKIALINVG
jgi:hypothetical protein